MKKYIYFVFFIYFLYIYFDCSNCSELWSAAVEIIYKQPPPLSGLEKKYIKSSELWSAAVEKIHKTIIIQNIISQISPKKIYSQKYLFCVFYIYFIYLF